MSETNRLDELLVDELLEGLDAAEKLERDWLVELTATDEDSFAQIVAEIDLAQAARSQVEISESLRSKVVASAFEHLPPPPRRPQSASWVSLAGWATAALCLCLLVVVWVAQSTPEDPSLSESRDRLLASTDETVKVRWKTWKDPSGDRVRGDVVWNNSQQEGYLRITGLPPNDSSRSQYQLWIIDKKRRHPVDGGVFNITDESAEAIIPISAKLKVHKPVGFGVTIERPGGVVVSDQSKAPIIALLE